MASVRSAHKSCLVAEQGSLKPHNLVSQTLNFVQFRSFFWQLHNYLSSHLDLNQSEICPTSLETLKLRRVSIIDRPTRFPDNFFIHLKPLNNNGGFYLSSPICCCAQPQTSKPILLWKSCNIETFINLILGLKQLMQKRKICIDTLIY